MEYEIQVTVQHQVEDVPGFAAQTYASVYVRHRMAVPSLGPRKRRPRKWNVERIDVKPYRDRWLVGGPLGTGLTAPLFEQALSWAIQEARDRLARMLQEDHATRLAH